MGLFLANINAMGVVALCILTFAWSIRTLKIGRRHQLVSGITFGAGAVVSMLDPILLHEGYRADARYLFVSLISAFGGGFAALTATSIAIGARILIGGSGVEVGVTCTAMAGLLAWRWGIATRSINKRPLRSWIMLMLVASFPIAVGFIIVGPATPYPALFRVTFATISIFAFGKLMESEKRRAAREQELDKAAGLDFLTQLPNRRALNDYLLSPRMHEDTGRAFLAIDIDHFKAINDRYGHQVGDDVLRAIGRQLKSSVKPGDFVARIGGEEFVVILHAPTKHEAREAGERLRMGLCLTHKADEISFPVTASLGSVFVKGKRWESSKVLNLADQALYEAKRSGRNQSQFIDEEDSRFVESESGTPSDHTGSDAISSA